MILVTVGSTYFDELIQEVDRLKSVGILEGEVICQIGSGTYMPQSCSHFRFARDFLDYLDACELLVTHGGITVLEAIWRNKPLVAIANASLSGDHQTSFLQAVSKTFGIVWGQSPAQLADLITKVNRISFAPKAPHLSAYVKSLIREA